MTYTTPEGEKLKYHMICKDYGALVDLLPVILGFFAFVKWMTCSVHRIFNTPNFKTFKAHVPSKAKQLKGII